MKKYLLKTVKPDGTEKVSDGTYHDWEDWLSRAMFCQTYPEVPNTRHFLIDPETKEDVREIFPSAYGAFRHNDGRIDGWGIGNPWDPAIKEGGIRRIFMASNKGDTSIHDVQKAILQWGKGLDFSRALLLMKSGYKVRRKFSRKGVYYEIPEGKSRPVDDSGNKMVLLHIDAILAEDWEIYESKD